MRAEGCPDEAQVSILLCADRRIHTLNREWRGQDKPTDVLSFSQLEEHRGKKAKPPVQPGVPYLLGDVVISVQTAAKQAQKRGATLDEELRFLLVHGILHLLGWNDETEKQLKGMLARQEEILHAK